MKIDFYGNKILPSAYRSAAIRRCVDTIARWWTWQAEPESTTILGRIARFLRSEGAYHCYDGGLLDRMELRDSLRRNFEKAGLTDKKM